MRKVDDGKPGLWPDFAIGSGGMVGEGTLVCMIMPARRFRSGLRRVASYAVTLVFTSHNASPTHLGV